MLHAIFQGVIKAFHHRGFGIPLRGKVMNPFFLEKLFKKMFDCRIRCLGLFTVEQVFVPV